MDWDFQQSLIKEIRTLPTTRTQLFVVWSIREARSLLRVLNRATWFCKATESKDSLGNGMLLFFVTTICEDPAVDSTCIGYSKHTELSDVFTFGCIYSRRSQSGKCLLYSVTTPVVLLTRPPVCGSWSGESPQRMGKCFASLADTWVFWGRYRCFLQKR